MLRGDFGEGDTVIVSAPGGVDGDGLRLEVLADRLRPPVCLTTLSLLSAPCPVCRAADAHECSRQCHAIYSTKIDVPTALMPVLACVRLAMRPDSALKL